MDDVSKLHEEIDWLKAQNEKYRKALEKISYGWSNPVKFPTHTEHRLLSKLEIEDIANEALKGE